MFNYKWIGETAYQEGLLLQNQWTQKIGEGHEPIILGLEHPRVISFGLRSNPKEDLYLPAKNLKSMGFKIIETRRGGEATLHNPGQLVIYPILPIKKWNLGVRHYVSLLEEATKSALQELGIESFSKHKDPGLYTSKGKIAFFGIRVSRGITSHGLSINVTNKLSDFSYIRSCGQSGESFDQIANYSSIPLNVLFDTWISHFRLKMTSITRHDRFL